MRPNIANHYPHPYNFPIDESIAALLVMPMGTARDMVRDGRLPIRGKARG